MTLTLQPRLRALVSGLALMAMALGGALVAFAPAAADIGGDEGGAPGGDLEEDDLDVSESALYAHPYTEALPPTLTDSVPPQVVCVVQPDLCPEELRPATEAIGGGIEAAQDEAPVSPVQPVPEGAVAVGYFGGFDRYESAVKFELPDLPDGDEVVAFNVSFAQEQPTYDLNSPAFRDVVQAAMVAIGDQDPGVIAERLPGILAEGEPVEFDSDAIRMEACPLTEPFEPEGAPQAQHADEMPREEAPDGEEVGEPAVDCMFGGTGTFNEDTERWEFDLAFAADAWASGELDNNGVLISPIGVGNLAYGDPDLTTNAQLTLDIEDVTVAYDTAEPPPPVEELDAPEALGEPEQSEDMALEDDGGSFDDAPADDGAGFDDGAADAPEVADDAAGGEDMDGEPVDDPEVAGEPELEQAAPASAEPGPAWFVWLLVPTFAGGAYLVGNAMTASPLAAVAGSERPGAMSRLIASRGGGGPTPA
jgi:hypothetical protein